MDVGEGGGGYGLVGVGGVGGGVVAGRGVGVDFDLAVAEVDYPNFRYAVAGVEREFFAAVGFDSGVGDFYEQEDVVGAGMA